MGPEALLFTGEHDVFTRPRDCREVGSVFERAWYTSVRHADHLFHLQQPEALIELIFGFAARTLSLAATDRWHAVESLDDSPPVADPTAGDAGFERYGDTRRTSSR